jgi:hypothetical protein
MSIVESPFLLQVDAAAYLQLSTRTLEAFRLRGGGPIYRKLGRRVVYRREDLDAWTEERVRTSTRRP